MKKGIGLPIQFIIVVIVSVIVLVVVLMFFFSAKAGAGSGISVSQAIAECQNACLEDQSSLTIDPTSATTSCVDPTDYDWKFCQNKIVETETKNCYDLTACTIHHGTTSCTIKEDSCP